MKKYIAIATLLLTTIIPFTAQTASPGISQPSQISSNSGWWQGFAGTCKAWGGKLASAVSEHKKTSAAIGVGLATLAAWYYWYNQLERQIMRATKAGKQQELERLLYQLVSNVNASAGSSTHMQKQVAALNLCRDIFTEHTLHVLPAQSIATINRICKPYYIAWTLAELMPVFTAAGHTINDNFIASAQQKFEYQTKNLALTSPYIINFALIALLHTFQLTNTWLEIWSNNVWSDNPRYQQMLQAIETIKNDRVKAVVVQTLRKLHNPDSMLLAAAQTNDYIYVQGMLNSGANPNAQSENGLTALMYNALTADNASITKLLIDRGANVNVGNNMGQTALMLATGRIAPGVNEIIKVLVEHGASIAITDNNGHTALDYLPTTIVLPEIKNRNEYLRQENVNQLMQTGTSQ